MMELIKDYEFDINYHPGKANTVADALSRKPRAPKQIAKKKKKKDIRKRKAMIAASRCSFIIDLERLTDYEFQVVTEPASGSVRSVVLALLVVESTILTRVLDSQKSDPDCMRWKKIELSDDAGYYSVDSSDGLRLKGRLVVPNTEELRRDNLHEAHKSKYTINPGGTKMYQDLKKQYRWKQMLLSM